MRWGLACLGSIIFCLTYIPIANASSQSSRPLGNPQSSILGLVLSLGVVLLLIVLCIRFLASRTHVQQRGSIAVIAARQLAPNRSVQVIEVGGRQLLVGVGEQVTLLLDLTEEDVLPGSLESEESEGDEVSTEVFAEVLATALDDVRHRHNSPSARGGAV